MKLMRVTLYDAPEGREEWGLINIDSIQMIVVKKHINNVPAPTTLVLMGKEVRVEETIEVIWQRLKELNGLEEG